jgi:hypothetical protein
MCDVSEFRLRYSGDLKAMFLEYLQLEQTACTERERVVQSVLGALQAYRVEDTTVPPSDSIAF